MANRFRGFLPVVVDVETGGFNPRTDALLQIAAVLLDMAAQGGLEPVQTISYHVKPFPDANIEPASLAVNGIKPHHPLRPALDEAEALRKVFGPVRTAVKDHGCTRAILVGHNAAFDLNFVNAAAERVGNKRSPFHPFSTFDTVSLAGLALGQTVLSRAAQVAGLTWDDAGAHSAAYDAEKTAELFCRIVNRWQDLGGWPID